MGSEPRRASLLDADLKFKAEADQDVNTKLKQWLPPLLEADELLQNFGSLLEEPVDEDGNPMIKLPYFDEEDRHRTPAVRNFSIPGKKQIFGSKGWDALFQAAQAARREGTKENQELKEYMLEAQKRLEEKESKKDASFNELYLLLNETPEEAAKRIKRIKETKKRILALRSAMQKTWMSKHGRVRSPPQG